MFENLKKFSYNIYINNKDMENHLNIEELYEELKRRIVLEFESTCEQLLVQQNFSDEEIYKFQTKILDKAQEKYLTK